MLHRPEKLLRDAGRSWELLVGGGVCALISATFAALLVWLAYLVAWRNPREYGVNDLYKVSTLFIFLVLIAIVAAFSVISFRLIRRKRGHPGLMSPMLLRIWGAFFGTMSIVVLIDAIIRERWVQAWHYLTILTGTISMAFAAFILARRRERSMSQQKAIRPQNGPCNGSQPIRSETNSTSSTAGSCR